MKDRMRKLGEKDKEETKTEQESVRKATFLRIYPTRKLTIPEGTAVELNRTFPTRPLRIRKEESIMSRVKLRNGRRNRKGITRGFRDAVRSTHGQVHTQSLETRQNRTTTFLTRISRETSRIRNTFFYSPFRIPPAHFLQLFSSFCASSLSQQVLVAWPSDHGSAYLSSNLSFCRWSTWGGPDHGKT